VPAQHLSGGTGAPLPVPDSGAFKIDVELQNSGADAEARVLLQTGEETYATVGYDFRKGTAFLVRDGDAAAKGEGAKTVQTGTAQEQVGDAYRQASTVVSPAVDGKVRLTVFVDRSSVEVFTNGGQTLTGLVFPPDGALRARMAGDGGAVSLIAATVTPLAAIR
jgi:levanbiose-producing levanase